MYDVTRRMQLSLIIPLIFVVALIIRILEVRSGTTVSTMPTTSYIIYFVIEILITYILSVIFFSIETFVKTYITDPTHPQSLALKQQLRVAPLKQKIQLLEAADKSDEKRITRSVILQLALVIFAIFAMSNPNSLIGIGVTLSVLLQMLFDQYMLLRGKGDASIWFWQIKRMIPRDVQTIYVGLTTIFFVYYALSLFR